MAGFPLMAFGAGLGQWAEARQRQQEADVRNKMLELTLSKYRDELADRQAQNQASDVLGGLDFSSLLGGTKPIGPVSGGFGGGGLPAASSMAPGMGELGPGFARGPEGGLTRNGQPPDATVGGNPAWRSPPSGGFGSPGEYGVGGIAPGMRELAQLAPQLRQPAGPWSGTMTEAPASAYAEVSGPGAPIGGGTPMPSNIPPPRAGGGPNTPVRVADASGAPQMAQAQPSGQQQQRSPIPGINIPPPENIDFGQILQAVKQQRPGISPAALRLVGEAIQKRLGENYKSAFERWKTVTGFGYEAQRIGQTDQQIAQTKREQDRRFGLDTEKFGFEQGTKGKELGQGDRRLDLTESGQTETSRANRETEYDRRNRLGLDTEKFGFERNTKTAELGQADQRIGQTDQQIAETNRSALARESAEQQRIKIAKDVADGRITKVQGEQTLAVTQLRTLADRARDLLGAVEANPNLVGARGLADRIRGSVTEQAKLGVTHSQLSEFQSEINLLRTEVLKPMAINKYMTKGALEELKKLVPSDEALTSPTQAKAALRNLARHLEQRASETEAVIGGVKKDYQGMSNEDLLKQLGVQPGAQ